MSRKLIDVYRDRLSGKDVWVLEYRGTNPNDAWCIVPESWVWITRDKTGAFEPRSLEACVELIHQRYARLAKTSLSWRIRNTGSQEVIPCEIL